MTIRLYVKLKLNEPSVNEMWLLDQKIQDTFKVAYTIHNDRKQISKFCIDLYNINELDTTTITFPQFNGTVEVTGLELMQPYKEIISNDIPFSLTITPLKEFIHFKR